MMREMAALRGLPGIGADIKVGMDISVNSFLVIGLGAGAVAAAVCLSAWPIARLLRVVDLPDHDHFKVHKLPTPLVGGLAVIAAMMPVLIWSIFAFEPSRLMTCIAMAIAAMTVIGLLDDRWHIPAVPRLLLASLVLGFAMFAAPVLQIDPLVLTFLESPLQLGIWAVPFSLLCLVGFTNAVNMADGRNGLVAGMALFWTILMGLQAPVPLQIILFATASALSIVLVFNLQGKLFLGDAGTYGLSALLGLTAVYLHNIAPLSMPGDLVVLMFIIPVADCLRLIVMRLLAGRSPLERDNDHLHHLVNGMMPWRIGLPLCLGLAAAPSLIWLTTGLPSLLVFFATLFVYAGFIVAGRMAAAGEAAQSSAS